MTFDYSMREEDKIQFIIHNSAAGRKLVYSALDPKYIFALRTLYDWSTYKLLSGTNDTISSFEPINVNATKHWESYTWLEIQLKTEFEM